MSALRPRFNKNTNYSLKYNVGGVVKELRKVVAGNTDVNDQEL